MTKFAYIPMTLLLCQTVGKSNHGFGSTFVSNWELYLKDDDDLLQVLGESLDESCGDFEFGSRESVNYSCHLSKVRRKKKGKFIKK
jgi:hypothetical protein